MNADDLQPLAGGFSGETFVDSLRGTVVRVYAHRGARRGTAAVEIDAAVLHLVSGLLPVPEVLELRPPSPGLPGMLVTSFLPGERLDTCLPALGDGARAAVAHNLGVALGKLTRMPMPRAGAFTDGALRIEPWAEGGDLMTWVAFQRRGSALADWPAEHYDGLLAVARTAQDVLGQVRRTCLVHSDFNPKNLLVDPATGALTGLLDWEFAHAGTPGADLGNLLRFDRCPGFVDGVLSGYLSTAGHLDGLARLSDAEAKAHLLALARAADLAALVELAGRRDENPVADRAHEHLLAVAKTGDPHALP